MMLVTGWAEKNLLVFYFFHAFSGCDNVSGFKGKGKTWNVCPDVTDVFQKLSIYPPVLNDNDIGIIQMYVVSLYDRSSPVVSVDEARFDMFARKQRSFDAIPPTKHRWLSTLNGQHIKLVVYGLKHWHVQWRKLTLLIGVGRWRTMYGQFVGLNFPQLLNHVSSLQNVDVSKIVGVDASVLSWVCLVLLCVVVNVIYRHWSYCCQNVLQ